MVRKILNGALLLAVGLLAAATLLFVRDYESLPSGQARQGPLRGRAGTERPGDRPEPPVGGAPPPDLGLSRRLPPVPPGAHAQGRGVRDRAAPSAARDLLAKLLEGKVYLRPITIPEGLTAPGDRRAVPGRLVPHQGLVRRGRRGPGPRRALGQAGLGPRGISFPGHLPLRQEHGGLGRGRDHGGAVREGFRRCPGRPGVRDEDDASGRS